MSTMQAKNKIKYIAPKIVTIKFDNEISLAMESDAPVGPGEVKLNQPDCFNNDPYKTNNV